MADGASTYRSIVKPEVGASEDSWGTKYNTMVELVDKALGAEMFGYLSATQTGAVGNTSTTLLIPFNTCSPNMGTLFNTTTRLFTAPAAGRLVGFLHCAFEGLNSGAGVSTLDLIARTSGGLDYSENFLGPWTGNTNRDFSMNFDIALSNAETVGFYAHLVGQASNLTDIAGVTKNKTHFSAKFIATP